MSDIKQLPPENPIIDELMRIQAQCNVAMRLLSAILKSQGGEIKLKLSEIESAAGLINTYSDPAQDACTITLTEENPEGEINATNSH